MRRMIFLLSFILLFPGVLSAQNESDGIMEFSLHYEKGFLKLWLHTLQIGDNATNFDYLGRGGQEILFPFERFSIDVHLFKNNKISFLYQPLTITTTTRYQEEVIIDTVTFPTGTIVDMKYGFPFYRITYSYQFPLTTGLQLGGGLALQLRNASITFSSADGLLFTSSQNLGPVPALHLNLLYKAGGGFFAYFEATGLYASSAFINGADFDFEGSILDSSLRLGMNFKSNSISYFNLRFLGGSARGTSEYSNARWSESRERYTANYLALWTLSLGVQLNLR